MMTVNARMPILSLLEETHRIKHSPPSSPSQSKQRDEPSLVFEQDTYATLTTVTHKLHYCCKTGNVELMDELLQEEIQKKQKFRRSTGSASIDLTSGYLDSKNCKSSLLHCAARYEQLESMKLLLEKYKMNIDCEDASQATPLYYSVASGKYNATATLLSMGASVNVRDEYENCPLLLGLKFHSQNPTVDSDFQMAKMLLLGKADIHFRTSKGKSLLHIAVESGDEEVIIFLLQNGASIFRTNRDNENVLYPAIHVPHILKILCDSIERNEQFMQTFSRLTLMRCSSGMSLLHVCASMGYLDSMKILLRTALSMYELVATSQEKEDILRFVRNALNDSEPTRGFTPLHFAVEHQMEEIVHFLCKYVEVDVNIKDKVNQSTPLHHAIMKRDAEVIRSLLVIGDADRKAKNSDNVSCHQLAQQSGITLLNTATEQETKSRKRRSLHLFPLAKFTSASEVVEAPTRLKNRNSKPDDLPLLGVYQLLARPAFDN